MCSETIRKVTCASDWRVEKAGSSIRRVEKNLRYSPLPKETWGCKKQGVVSDHYNSDLPYKTLHRRIVALHWDIERAINTNVKR